MNNIFINRIAFGLFVFLNIIVGIWVGKKVYTLKDYAIAKRKLGSGSLTMSVLATLISANSFLTIHRVYIRGIGALLPILAIFVSIFVLGRCFFPYLVHFKGCYTIGDIMGRLYGSTGRFLTFLTGAIVSILAITTELIAMKYVSCFLAINPTYLIVMTGLIATAYSFLGGVRSVAITDVMQFALIVVAIVLVTNIALFKGGYLKKVFRQVYCEYPEHIMFWQHSFFNYVIFSSFFHFFSTILVTPPIVQRALMAKSKRQVRDVFTTSSLFFLFFYGLVLIIGFIVLVNFNQCGAEVDTSNILLYIANFLLDSNPFLEGLFVLAFIAAVLSTLDSYLSSLIVSLIRDMINPFYHQKKRNVYAINNTRVIGVIIGCVCTFLAYLFHYYPPFIIMIYALAILSSLALPFIVGVLGMKTSEKIFLVYMGVFLGSFMMIITFVCQTGFSVFPHWIFPPPGRFHFMLATSAWLFASLTAGCMFFALHYREHGKLAWVSFSKKMKKETLSLSLQKQDVNKVQNI
ncbi:MAG: sodium:solute symporter family protein [Bacteroidota bacterium]